jgi:predicted RNA binding protein YcfA (HicA-like mRNA interferase family)
VKRARWQELVKVCLLSGWVEDRTKGDHLIMTKPGTARPVVIKMDRNLGEDLIQSVKRAAGLSTQEFHSLLEQVRTGKKIAKPTTDQDPLSERPN